MRNRILILLSAALLDAAAAASAAPQPSLVVKAKGRWTDAALKFSARYKKGAGAIAVDGGAGTLTGPVSCQANAGRLVVLGGTLDVPVPGYPYFVAILEDHANLGGPDEFVFWVGPTPFDCDFVIGDHGMGNLLDTRAPIVGGKIVIQPEN